MDFCIKQKPSYLKQNKKMKKLCLCVKFDYITWIKQDVLRVLMVLFYAQVFNSEISSFEMFNALMKLNHC